MFQKLDFSTPWGDFPEQNLNLLFVVLCGIISKLKFPDIEENCANYDILCFFESKIDDLDEIEFSGFVKLPPLNRKY